MKDNMTYAEFLEVNCSDFVDLLQNAHNLDVKHGMSFKPFDDPEDDFRKNARQTEHYPLGFNLILRIPRLYLKEKFFQCKDAKSNYEFLGCIEEVAKGFFTGEYADEKDINTSIFEEETEAGNDFYEVNLRVEFSKIDKLLEDHPKITNL